MAPLRNARCWLRLATRRGNRVEAAEKGRRVEDAVVGAPTAAAGVRGRSGLREGARTAAQQVGDLEPVLGEEAELPAVGRPEGVARVRRARDQGQPGSVERAHPECRPAVLTARHEREPPAVGREREPADEDVTRGRRDLELGVRPCGRTTPVGRRHELRHERPQRETRDERRRDERPERPLRHPLPARRRALLGPTARDLVEHEARVGDVVQAVLRVPFEATAQQSTDRRWRRLRQLREVDLGLQHSGQRVAHRVGREQRPTDEHLEEHYAERPDVRPLVDRAAPRLLRSHVGRRAQDHPELRAVRRGQRRRLHQRRRARQITGRNRTGARRRIHRLGQAEVEDLGLSFYGSFDVLGLEIAVDDALLVGFLQRFRDLLRDGKAFI